MVAVENQTRDQYPIHYQTVRINDLGIFCREAGSKTAPVILHEEKNAMTHTANRQKDVVLAYFLLRVTIGTNIFIHGLSRILAGPSHFADALVLAFQHAPLPSGLVRLFALILPCAESVVGLLVLIGVRTRLTLVAGSFLILTLTFGATLNQDWESAGLQLIYAAVYASLLAFRHQNTLSIDALLERNSFKGDRL